MTLATWGLLVAAGSLVLLLLAIVGLLCLAARRRPRPGIYRGVHLARPLPSAGKPGWCRKSLDHVRLCTGCPHYRSGKPQPPIRAGRS